MGKKIGFIGLGTMGLPMASNLLDAGHSLLVYDVDASRAPLLDGRDAEPCGSPREAAGGAEVVITMLPASPHVLAPTLGPEGAVEGLRPGATLIDMSTIDPGPPRRVCPALAPPGARILGPP